VYAGVEHIAEEYERAGAAEYFSYFIQEGVGHELLEEMWQRTRDHFSKHF